MCADIVGGAKHTVKVKELAKSGVGTAVMTHLLLKFHSLYFHGNIALFPGSPLARLTTRSEK